MAGPGFSFTDFIQVISEPATLNNYLTTIGPIEIDQYDYLGFNFKLIVQKFCSNAAKNNRSKDDMIKDAVNIVAIGLNRGNIRVDQIEKTMASGKARIRELATRYEIPLRQNKSSKINLQPDTLSFTRSLSVFPHFASMLLTKEPSKAKEGKRLGLDTHLMPAAMKHGGFGALIPSNCSNLVQSVYIASYAAYMIEFGEIINPADTRKTFVERYNFQKAIILAAQSGGCLDDKTKSYYLTITGLCDPAVFNVLVDVTNKLMAKIGRTGVSAGQRTSCIIQNKVLVCDTIENQNALMNIVNNINSISVSATVHQPAQTGEGDMFSA